MSRPACTSRSHPLSRKPRSEPTDGSPDGEPVGPLTPLLERYRGRNLPQACAGFGLPKIYEELSHALGRPVPTTETEATAVSEWLAQHGPFEPKAFRLALTKTIATLGPGRPLSQVIQSLSDRIQQPKQKEEHRLNQTPAERK